MTINDYPLILAQQGWECPRCHKVNAPWMPHCTCNQETKLTWTQPTTTTDEQAKTWHEQNNKPFNSDKKVRG